MILKKKSAPKTKKYGSYRNLKIKKSLMQSWPRRGTEFYSAARADFSASLVYCIDI